MYLSEVAKGIFERAARFELVRHAETGAHSDPVGNVRIEQAARLVLHGPRVVGDELDARPIRAPLRLVALLHLLLIERHDVLHRAEQVLGQLCRLQIKSNQIIKNIKTTNTSFNRSYICMYSFEKIAAQVEVAEDGKIDAHEVDKVRHVLELVVAHVQVVDIGRRLEDHKRRQLVVAHVQILQQRLLIFVVNSKLNPMRILLSLLLLLLLTYQVDEVVERGQIVEGEDELAQRDEPLEQLHVVATHAHVVHVELGELMVGERVALLLVERLAVVHERLERGHLERERSLVLARRHRHRRSFVQLMQQQLLEDVLARVLEQVLELDYVLGHGVVLVEQKVLMLLGLAVARGARLALLVAERLLHAQTVRIVHG